MKQGQPGKTKPRGWLADAAAAVALLTILPMPLRWQEGAAWPRAMRALPIVGLLAGLVTGSVLWLSLLVGAPAGVAALVAMMAGVVLTGALHEDGLADMADAMGGRTRQRRLEILRDVHAGTFAILALLFTLAMQAAALTTLMHAGASRAVAALLAAHVLSRMAMVILAHRLPPAREDGMGHSVARPGIGVTGLAGIIAALAAFPPLMFSFGPAVALMVMFVAIVVAEGSMEWLARKYFDGQTGDILGATEVVSRTTTLLTLVLLAG